jgi:hypothetical protein
MGIRKQSPSSLWSADWGADPHTSRGLRQTGWRLPSGQTLAEFASRSGFVAPRLLPANTLGQSRPGPTAVKGPR